MERWTSGSEGVREGSGETADEGGGVSGSFVSAEESAEEWGGVID
jgi:hypothetical protein